MDGSDECFGRYGLLQEAVDLEVAKVLRRTRNNNHRNVTGEDVGGEVLPNFDSVEHRQAQIKDDEIRRMPLKLLNGLHSVTGLCDVVTSDREGDAEERAEIVVIFDDENPLPPTIHGRILAEARSGSKLIWTREIDERSALRRSHGPSPVRGIR